jgi:hypothetical protein
MTISGNKQVSDTLLILELPIENHKTPPIPACRRAGAIHVLALCLLLCACSPALNWRSVTLEGVQATLPCKPDQAQRLVQLAGLDLTLSMAGCEADDGLYAVSHLRLAQGAQAQPVIDAWRAQALQTMRATAAPVATPLAALGARPALTVYQASGTNPSGQPVHARWTWVQRDRNIYHWALYAPVIRAEMAEPFFSTMQWQ